MKITKKELKELLREEIEATIGEGAQLKIPVERYDNFKRKIEQWGMLFNKFTGYARDMTHPDFDRDRGGRLLRMVTKLNTELHKIMDEFDLDYKDYDDEKWRMRQKLDQFDGDHEIFQFQEQEEES